MPQPESVRRRHARARRPVTEVPVVGLRFVRPAATRSTGVEEHVRDQRRRRRDHEGAGRRRRQAATVTAARCRFAPRLSVTVSVATEDTLRCGTVRHVHSVGRRAITEVPGVGALGSARRAVIGGRRARRRSPSATPAGDAGVTVKRHQARIRRQDHALRHQPDIDLARELTAEVAGVWSASPQS